MMHQKTIVDASLATSVRDAIARLAADGFDRLAAWIDGRPRAIAINDLGTSWFGYRLLGAAHVDALGAMRRCVLRIRTDHYGDIELIATGPDRPAVAERWAR